MPKQFKTYTHKSQTIKPEDNTFFMYLQDGNSWVFKGIVSQKAKEYVQSEEYITNLNNKFKDEIILGSFTGKDAETTKKVYLFIPCPHAEVITYFPVFDHHHHQPQT